VKGESSEETSEIGQKPTNSARKGSEITDLTTGESHHVSLVMRAYAMMAAVRLQANQPPPKKRCPTLQDITQTYPLVGPGNQADRTQVRAKTYPACLRYSLVAVATNSSSNRSTGTIKI